MARSKSINLILFVPLAAVVGDPQSYRKKSRETWENYPRSHRRQQKFPVSDRRACNFPVQFTVLFLSCPWNHQNLDSHHFLVERERDAHIRTCIADSDAIRRYAAADWADGEQHRVLLHTRLESNKAHKKLEPFF